jgi:hypothetical protein
MREKDFKIGDYVYFVFDIQTSGQNIDMCAEPEIESGIIESIHIYKNNVKFNINVDEDEVVIDKIYVFEDIKKVKQFIINVHQKRIDRIASNDYYIRNRENK